MRPPMCAICGKEDFDLKKGGLVYFALRTSDQKWEKKMKDKGMVGHPPYAEWFCEKHFPKAKELENLTIDKAMDVLKKEFL